MNRPLVQQPNWPSRYTPEGLRRYLLRIYPNTARGLEWSHSFEAWDDKEAVQHVQKWVTRDPIVRDGTFDEIVLYHNEAPHYSTIAVYLPDKGWTINDLFPATPLVDNK